MNITIIVGTRYTHASQIRIYRITCTQCYKILGLRLHSQDATVVALNHAMETHPRMMALGKVEFKLK